ncbi:heterokaryon incompatibility domain-containing protein [Trichoderma sp. SZMC 28014]
MSLETHNKVSWQPLSSARSEIRILEVSPAQSASDSIICHLQTVSLLDQPEYEALSYVWGTSSSSRQIFLNGNKITVTDNLFDALTYLRDVKKIRALWVDAVCINQKDDAEKGIQIMMMGKIYSQASQVLVWLLKVAPPALLLNDIISFGQDQEKHYTENPYSLFVLSKLSWWRRAWTFQEAGLAKNLIFHIGEKRFALKDLEAYCNSLLRHLFHPEACCTAAFSNKPVIAQEAFSSALRTLNKLLQCRKIINQNDQGLLYLIAENSDRAATNPRDKVYAYLGLTHDIPTNFIKYDLPLKEWNIYTSTKLIQHSMSLKTVSYASPSGIVGDDREKMDGLPSWCPDWTQSMRDPIFLETRQQHVVYGWRYAASGQTKASPFFPTKGVLGVKGVLCDAIAHVGRSDQYRTGPGQSPEVLQQWCHLVAHSNSVHQAICDECDKIIYGVRNQCLVCHNFDLCSKCFTKSEDNHSGHSFNNILSACSKGDTCNQGDKKKLRRSNQVPAIIITAFENGYNVENSSWERLENMDYPFSKGDTVQDAFRKVLVANASFIGSNKDEQLSESEIEPFLQEIAFTEFWSLKIENRPAVAIRAKEGYTADQVSLMLAGLSEHNIKFLASMIKIILNGKRLFVSNEGYIGWGPNAMMPGDTIAVLYGSKMPFVLRAVSDQNPQAGLANAYTVVGECYVHGLMNGEALQNAKMSEQDFLLY